MSSNSSSERVKASRGKTSEEKIAQDINNILTDSSDVVVESERNSSDSLKVILKTSLNRSERNQIDEKYKILEVGGVNLPSGDAGTGLILEF